MKRRALKLDLACLLCGQTFAKPSNLYAHRSRAPTACALKHQVIQLQATVAALQAELQRAQAFHPDATRVPPAAAAAALVPSIAGTPQDGKHAADAVYKSVAEHLRRCPPTLLGMASATAYALVQCIRSAQADLDDEQFIYDTAQHLLHIANLAGNTATDREYADLLAAFGVLHWLDVLIQDPIATTFAKSEHALVRAKAMAVREWALALHSSMPRIQKRVEMGCMSDPSDMARRKAMRNRVPLDPHQLRAHMAKLGQANGSLDQAVQMCFARAGTSSAVYMMKLRDHDVSAVFKYVPSHPTRGMTFVLGVMMDAGMDKTKLTAHALARALKSLPDTQY